MPRTDVVFYSEEDGRAPVLEWMDGLPQKAQDKCIVKIERLVLTPVKKCTKIAGFKMHHSGQRT